MIMASLIRIGPDVPVTKLRSHLIRKGHHELPAKQVHTALDRLVARGYVTSWTRKPRAAYQATWLYPRPDVRRRSRRFVSLTTLGRRALRVATAPVDRLRWGLPGLGHDDRLWQRFAPRGVPRLGPWREAGPPVDARRAAWPWRRLLRSL
jgi:hypothetical protein